MRGILRVLVSQMVNFCLCSEGKLPKVRYDTTKMERKDLPYIHILLAPMTVTKIVASLKMPVNYFINTRDWESPIEEPAALLESIVRAMLHSNDTSVTARKSMSAFLY